MKIYSNIYIYYYVEQYKNKYKVQNWYKEVSNSQSAPTKNASAERGYYSLEDCLKMLSDVLFYLFVSGATAQLGPGPPHIRGF